LRKALKAALLNGLDFRCRATGTRLPGNADELVEQQAAAIRRASHRVDPPNVHNRPPLQLQPPEPPAEGEQPPLPWWKRD
jgi:hypothetical protein